MKKFICKTKGAIQDAKVAINEALLNVAVSFTPSRAKTAVAGGAGMAAFASATSLVFAQSALQSKLVSMFIEGYDFAIGIANYAAVTLVAIALIVRLLSKNPRSIETATAWAKNIVQTWIVIRLIPLIFNTMKNLFEKEAVSWEG